MSGSLLLRCLDAKPHAHAHYASHMMNPCQCPVWHEHYAPPRPRLTWARPRATTGSSTLPPALRVSVTLCRNRASLWTRGRWRETPYVDSTITAANERHHKEAVITSQPDAEAVTCSEAAGMQAYQPGAPKHIACVSESSPM
jgi:hypothetical protein